MSESVRNAVERFARGAEDLSKSMDSAGVGGHPTLGHSALLRRMAASMRADAAMGRTPYAYSDSNAMYATGQQRLSASSQATLRNAELVHLLTGDPITMSDLDGLLSSAGTPLGERFQIKSILASAGKIVTA